MKDLDFNLLWEQYYAKVEERNNQDEEEFIMAMGFYNFILEAQNKRIDENIEESAKEEQYYLNEIEQGNDSSRNYQLKEWENGFQNGLQTSKHMNKVPNYISCAWVYNEEI